MSFSISSFQYFSGRLIKAQELEISIKDLNIKEKAIFEASCITYYSINTASQFARVTCNKKVSNQGTIAVVIDNNTEIRSFRSDCEAYIPGSGSTNEIFCLSKYFDYDLATLNLLKTYFDIDCYIVNAPEINATKRITKLCKETLQKIILRFYIKNF